MKRGCCGRARGTRGFTLLEVLVALSLSGLVLASLVELLASVGLMAILLRTMGPQLPALTSTFSLRGATRQVAGDLQKARMAAMAENNRYVFTIVDTHTYSVHDDNNNGVADAGEAANTVDVRSTSPGITVSTSGTLTFVPDGTATQAATITVTGSMHSKTVMVSAAGRIRVQ